MYDIKIRRSDRHRFDELLRQWTFERPGAPQIATFPTEQELPDGWLKLYGVPHPFLPVAYAAGIDFFEAHYKVLRLFPQSRTDEARQVPYATGVKVRVLGEGPPPPRDTVDRVIAVGPWEDFRDDEQSGAFDIAEHLGRELEFR